MQCLFRCIETYFSYSGLCFIYFFLEQEPKLENLIQKSHFATWQQGHKNDIWLPQNMILKTSKTAYLMIHIVAIICDCGNLIEEILEAPSAALSSISSVHDVVIYFQIIGAVTGVRKMLPYSCYKSGFWPQIGESGKIKETLELSSVYIVDICFFWCLTTIWKDFVIGFVRGFILPDLVLMIIHYAPKWFLNCNLSNLEQIPTRWVCRTPQSVFLTKKLNCFNIINIIRINI